MGRPHGDDPDRHRRGPGRVSVTGSESDRTGSDTVRVVRDKQLGLSTAKQRVRASDDQSVTVTGLASGEKVTVSYQGRRVSPRVRTPGPWAATRRRSTWPPPGAPRPSG